MRAPHSRHCHISSASGGFVLDLRKRERISARKQDLDTAARARMLGRRGDLSRDEATVQVRHMPPAPRPSE